MEVSANAAVQAVLSVNRAQQTQEAQLAMLGKAMAMEKSTVQGLLNALPQLATSGTVGTRLHAIA